MRVHDRMALSLAILVSILAATLQLSAAQMQLATGGAPFRLGWREAPLSQSPSEKLKAEPVYKSNRVLYMPLQLGNGEDSVITGVLDESQGPGKGYDTLYLDANNNGDLTDDPVIKLRVERAGLGTSLSTEPLDIVVKYAGATQRTLRVRLEIRGSQQKSSSKDVSWSVGYHVDQHLEGKVDIGDRKGVLIGIYDSSSGKTQSNGCFDDFCVDRLRIDLNGDGKLDSKEEDMPLSRVIFYDGKLWELKIDSPGLHCELSPCAVPTGDVGFGFSLAAGARVKSGSIELSGDNNCGFRLSVPVKDRIALPEGAYLISSIRLFIVDGAGREWQSLAAMSKPVVIKHGEATALTMGAPLKMGLAYKGELKPEGEVCLMPVLTGAAGEVYENIALAETRMTPDVKVVDAVDVVVAEGRMDYG